MINTILILGPTASGKSKLATQIAKEANGEVINMDSMQIYKDLPILSACPTKKEMNGVPHHLFGTIDAAHPYSTGEYIRDAKVKIDEIIARGKMPVLVGGTGLYAHALTEGMVETPPVPAAIRAQTRKIVEADRKGSYNRLRKFDPEAAERIEPNDAVRISRALEVYEATGKSLSDWHREPQPPILAEGTWLGIALSPPRELVYENIAKRFYEMVDNGGLEEVEALLKRGLPNDLPAMKALGVPNIISYLMGEISQTEAISKAILETRHYAKRQYTWLRNRATNWQHLEKIDEKSRLESVFSLL